MNLLSRTVADVEVIFILGPQGCLCCIVVTGSSSRSFSNSREFMCKLEQQMGKREFKQKVSTGRGRVELLQLAD